MKLCVVVEARTLSHTGTKLNIMLRKKITYLQMAIFSFLVETNLKPSKPLIVIYVSGGFITNFLYLWRIN